jgi:hypothetical protein
MTTVNLLGKYGMPMVPKLSKGISESHRISELWRFRLCFCYNFIKHRSPGPSIFWGNDEFHLADSPWGPAPPGDSLPSWLNFEPGSLLFAGAHRAVDIWVIPAERYMTSNDLNGKHLKGKMWKKRGKIWWDDISRKHVQFRLFSQMLLKNHVWSHSRAVNHSPRHVSAWMSVLNWITITIHIIHQA